MYCKECGVENSNNSLRCKKCGTNLMLENTPLAGGERVKIILFFVLLLAGGIFSIIPYIIILSGIYIMKKDKSFSAIVNSQLYINIYLGLLALFLIVLTFQIRFTDWELYALLISYVIGAPIISVIMNFLYFNIIKNHQNWIINNGIFSDEIPSKMTSSLQSKKNVDINISKSSISTADELLKWKKLLDMGAISQTEFDEKKRSILSEVS